MDIAALRYLLAGSRFTPDIAEQINDELRLQYAARAQELLLACHLAVPSDYCRLTIIVDAGLEARALYWVAALHQPPTEDLDKYFDEFVIRTVSVKSDWTDADFEN
jgi:hypothetical protein